MYCCLSRELHLRWSRLKEMPEPGSPVENSFTGIETNPNEMLAVEIARAAIKIRLSPVFAGASSKRPRIRPGLCYSYGATCTWTHLVRIQDGRGAQEVNLRQQLASPSCPPSRP